jgi:hypothetical protein
MVSDEELGTYERFEVSYLSNGQVTRCYVAESLPHSLMLNFAHSPSPSRIRTPPHSATNNSRPIRSPSADCSSLHDTQRFLDSACKTTVDPVSAEEQ